MAGVSLSVVIPVYNAERFLQDTIRSVLVQPEVTEVVIVDDGSTDNSNELCKKLQQNDARIKIFAHHDLSNHGIGASRNLGIEKAKGSLIAFLDADDYYLPGRFHNDIKILSGGSSIDGVYNAIGSHVYDNKESHRANSNLTTTMYSIPPDRLFDEMAPMGSAGYFSGDSLTVRRGIFDKVGMFDTDLEIGEDTHMWMKMAARAILVGGILSKAVAMRGVHSGNTTKDREKFVRNRPILFISLLRWANKNDISAARKINLWELSLKHYWDYLHYQGTSKLNKKIKLIAFYLCNLKTIPYLFGYAGSLVTYLKR
jgi:glycosyltransferase involved in cell wall biosynthesis